MTQKPKKFIPRTDVQLEAMQIPAGLDYMAYKDKEEVLRPILAWLSDRGVMFRYDVNLGQIRIERKFQQPLLAASGEIIMIRHHDIVVFEIQEFEENYEEAPSQE